MTELWRKLRVFCASLAVTALHAVPALAQDDNIFLKKPDKGPPVAEFAVAMIVTMIVLVVVCMPSRKR